ncbi:MAG: ureidoglycolate lyase [Pseudomonadota bacterium]
MKNLALSALTADAFSAFGDVVDSTVVCDQYPINAGRTTRHHALSRVDCSNEDGEPVISIFRASPVEDGFVMHGMERHPLGSQTFVNLSPYPYAIVVAPVGEFDESKIVGFIARPQQSITYHRGTWHHYLLALEGASDFVVIDRVGPGENCDEVALANPLKLTLPR